MKTPKKFLTFYQNESFSNCSAHRTPHPPKNPYISGNGASL